MSLISWFTLYPVIFVSSTLSALSYSTSFLSTCASVGAFSLYSENYTWGLKGYCSMAFLIRYQFIYFSFSLYYRIYNFFYNFFLSIDWRSLILGWLASSFFFRYCSSFYLFILSCSVTFFSCYCLTSFASYALFPKSYRYSRRSDYLFFSQALACCSARLISFFFSSCLRLQSALSAYSYFYSFSFSSLRSSFSASFCASLIFFSILRLTSFSTLQKSSSFSRRKLRLAALIFLSLQILATMQSLIFSMLGLLTLGNSMPSLQKYWMRDLPLPMQIWQRWRNFWQVLSLLMTLWLKLRASSQSRQIFSIYSSRVSCNRLLAWLNSSMTSEISSPDSFPQQFCRQSMRWLSPSSIFLSLSFWKSKPLTQSAIGFRQYTISQYPSSRSSVSIQLLVESLSKDWYYLSRVSWLLLSSAWMSSIKAWMSWALICSCCSCSHFCTRSGRCQICLKSWLLNKFALS